MAEGKTSKRSTKKAGGEAEALATIAELAQDDRAIAERLFALIKTIAPELSPKMWYAMPAWAKDDKVVCFFQSGQQFKTRYSTLGFQQAANLDQGSMWPVAFALTKMTDAEEAEISVLVKRAIS
jgi:uncharacterized protein YdhG (YjbR/CyaY superfamily)